MPYLKASKFAAAVFLVFFIFVGWQSAPQTIRDFSIGGSGQAAAVLSLPRWDGRDFSIIPSWRVEIPLKELPSRFTPPRKFPLPRDLDRDFDP